MKYLEIQIFIRSKGKVWFVPVISKKDNLQLEERKSQAKQYIDGLKQLNLFYVYNKIMRHMIYKKQW